MAAGPVDHVTSSANRRRDKLPQDLDEKIVLLVSLFFEF